MQNDPSLQIFYPRAYDMHVPLKPLTTSIKRILYNEINHGYMVNRSILGVFNLLSLGYSTYSFRNNCIEKMFIILHHSLLSIPKGIIIRACTNNIIIHLQFLFATKCLYQLVVQERKKYKKERSSKASQISTGKIAEEIGDLNKQKLHCNKANICTSDPNNLNSIFNLCKTQLQKFNISYAQTFPRNHRTLLMDSC